MAASTVTAAPDAADEAAVLLVSIAMVCAWVFNGRAGRIALNRARTARFHFCPVGRWPRFGTRFMQPLLLLELLILLTVANGTPVIAKKILGDRLARPLDGGTLFYDGKPVFGPTKTIRGIVTSLLATSLAAWLMGLQWELGVVVAAAAMAGDLCSSFVKRRMTLPSSSMALGLDQIPESLAATAWEPPAAAAQPSRRPGRRRDLLRRSASPLSHPVPFQLARPALLIGVRFSAAREGDAR